MKSYRNRVGGGQSAPRLAPVAAGAVTELAPERAEDADRALRLLTDSALEPIVDMVLVARDGAYEARTHDGMVRFRRGEAGDFDVVETHGVDPLADQSTDRYTPLADELAHRNPHRSENSYPFAYEQVAQLFDHPAAPDLCVIHSADHNWEDQGGHRGEHGSLGVVQARAPFVLAGKGVRADGLVPRAARLVDVAPTVLALLGVPPGADGRHLAGQDGVVREDVLDLAGGAPSHVVVFLFDGTNPNVLYDMAARGEAPNTARLIDQGTGFLHGAMAGLPTVTLANHTSILTGRLPGHHGILHNAWFDRRSGEQIITNSNDTWPHAMDHAARGCGVDPQRAAPPRCPARSRHRSTSPATSMPTTRRSTSSDGARCHRSRRVRTGSHTRRSASCGRRRTTGGRRWSITWARSRRWGSGAGSTGTRLPASPVHVRQLHVDRRRHARRWTALGDRRRIDPRQ